MNDLTIPQQRRLKRRAETLTIYQEIQSLLRDDNIETKISTELCIRRALVSNWLKGFVIFAKRYTETKWIDCIMIPMNEQMWNFNEYQYRFDMSGNARIFDEVTESISNVSLISSLDHKLLQKYLTPKWWQR